VKFAHEPLKVLKAADRVRMDARSITKTIEPDVQARGAGGASMPAASL
jgi:hypothetical protein